MARHLAPFFGPVLMSPDNGRNRAPQILGRGFALGPARLNQRLQSRPVRIRQHCPLLIPGGAKRPSSQPVQVRTGPSNFLPTGNAVLEQNALVVNTGDKLVLFDTGMGSLTVFGPTTGKLMNSLKQAGIDPKDIDAVVMSHAHIDHCGGCMADDGSRHFPNAEYYITQADYDFWTDESRVPSEFKVFLDTARKNLTPNRDRMRFIKDSEEFLPGIQAILAPGHTVGHTIFMITSGGQSLCYVGDLAHHPVLLLEKPVTEFKYDTDPKQSAQTRVKMLTMLADKKIPLLAYHFAWPGIGYVAKQGDGFRYYPEAMKMEL